MNNQIQIRRPAEDIVNNKKNIYQIMNYIKLNEQLEKYLNLLRVLTKNEEHEMDIYRYRYGESCEKV